MGVVFYLKNERQRNFERKSCEEKNPLFFRNDILKIFHFERSEI
jgi:hypothetical protein